jgi:hypothetical protein
MRKENCTGEELDELPRDPLGGRSSLSSPHQSSHVHMNCVKTKPATTSNTARAAVSVPAGVSENRYVGTGQYTVATIVHHIMTAR